MKKFSAVLLAIVLSLAVFSAVGCGKKVELKMTDVIEKIDFSKGVTVNMDMDVEMKSASGNQKVNSSALLKAIVDNGVLMADIVGDGNTIEGYGEVGKVEEYIRGNEMYVRLPDTDENNGEPIYVKMAAPATISDAFPYMDLTSTDDDLKIGNDLIDDEVKFVKDGDGYKAEIDVFDIALRNLKKVGDIADLLYADTTLKEIYDKVDGDELFDKIFGDVTGKEAYAQLIQVLGNLPNDTLPPEFQGVIANTDVDGFISMLDFALKMQFGSDFSIKLPKMEDKTLAQYFKQFIADNSTLTLSDLMMLGATGMTEEEKAAYKQVIAEDLADTRVQMQAIVSELTTALEGSDCIVSVFANAEGIIEKMTMQLSVGKEFINVIVSDYDVDLDDVDVDSVNIDMECSFQWSATDFKDVSKLQVKDDETIIIEPVEFDMTDSKNFIRRIR